MIYIIIISIVIIYLYFKTNTKENAQHPTKKTNNFGNRYSNKNKEDYYEIVKKYIGTEKIKNLHKIFNQSKYYNEQIIHNHLIDEIGKENLFNQLHKSEIYFRDKYCNSTTWTERVKTNKNYLLLCPLKYVNIELINEGLKEVSTMRELREFWNVVKKLDLVLDNNNYRHTDIKKKFKNYNSFIAYIKRNIEIFPSLAEIDNFYKLSPSNKTSEKISIEKLLKELETFDELNKLFNNELFNFRYKKIFRIDNANNYKFYYHVFKINNYIIFPKIVEYLFHFSENDLEEKVKSFSIERDKQLNKQILNDTNYFYHIKITLDISELKIKKIHKLLDAFNVKEYFKSTLILIHGSKQRVTVQEYINQNFNQNFRNKSFLFKLQGSTKKIKITNTDFKFLHEIVKFNELNELVYEKGKLINQIFGEDLANDYSFYYYVYQINNKIEFPDLIRQLFQLKSDDLNRRFKALYINKTEKFDIKITFDFHELRVHDVETFLDFIKNNKNRDDIRLEAIHGYNHGTAIRDFINEYSERNGFMKIKGSNPGRTVLLIND